MSRKLLTSLYLDTCHMAAEETLGTPPVEPEAAWWQAWLQLQLAWMESKYWQGQWPEIVRFVLLLHDDFDEAEEHLRAEDLNRKIGNVVYLAYVLIYLSRLYRRRGRPDSAAVTGGVK